ncbi:UNVERIFIED_CONTAM: hypothetical protein FKN15_021685 [Acipenser sinensis]
MGRKSCRKQQKQLSPQPAVATPLPPLPPGSPPSREIGDWLVHPEGKMEGWRDGCRDLEDLLGGLEDQGWCMACGVQGHTVAICPFQGEEEEEQQPGCYCCAEPGHSSTNCPWYPLGQLPQRCPICGGEHFVAHCPVHQEREEQESPQSPPPAGGGRLLLPPPQPQVQQRPEEPENLFPWCTWCGEVDHRWRDCSEVPPSWCGRCEEGGHDWSGCPYASSPVPKREEPERPQPKEEEVGASIALGPKLPAEGECLLVPPPPAEEKCLLSPCAPAEDECLLSPSPPAEGECLLGPRPPAEDECLLVSLPPPALTPAREGDKPQSPARKAEPHQSPAREAEQDQSPAKGGDYTLLPPSSPGDHMLLPPPLLPPQEPEGEELQAQPPEIFWGGEGQDAGVPQQPLFLLLKAARRAPARPPQQREPAPPQPPSEWPASAPSPLPPPPPPAEGEYLLVPPSLLWEDCLPLPPPPAEGRTVAGAPERGATGYEERGSGPETCSHCSSFAAGDRGGGQETCSHRSTFAAGSTVAAAPPWGAAGYEEGGGQGTTCPRSFSAARTVPHAVGRATTGRGADSMASHGPTEASLPSSMASHGPSEASLPSPRLCPGLLGF